ncbi:MAG: LAGLIDADG family homing endonuclease, partial [Candidatus Nanosalina sp.]
MIGRLKDLFSNLFGDSEKEDVSIGIYGPPNAGKCLAEGEEIILADGRSKRIEDVFENISKTCPDAIDVSNEPEEVWLECAEADIEVPSLNEDLEIEPRKITHVFRQNYSGKMYEVETRLGKKVTVSPEHPFIVVTDEGLRAVRAKNLDENTPVAHAQKLQTVQSSFELKSNSVLETTVNGNLKMKSKYHDPKSTSPIEINPRNARFIAMFVAEGQHTERYVSFTNTSERLLEEFGRTAEERGLDPIRYDNGGSSTIRVNNRSFVEHLKQLGLEPGVSRQKSVPEPVIAAEDDIVREFLQVMFDCEGCVEGSDSDERGRYITASSASRQLITDIQVMLLRFGIVGKIREKKEDGKTYYEFSIGRSSQHRKFKQEIGFGNPEKAEKLDKLCEAGSSASIHTLPLMDKLEGMREEIGATQKEFYLDNKHVARMKRKNSISIDRIEKMADELPENESTELVHNLANSEVVWDEVRNIEEIDYDGHIYDLTVEKNHNFMIKDGLIVHNSTLANEISKDLTGEEMSNVSEVPHETRAVEK